VPMARLRQLCEHAVERSLRLTQCAMEVESVRRWRPCGGFWPDAAARKAEIGGLAASGLAKTPKNHTRRENESLRG